MQAVHAVYKKLQDQQLTKALNDVVGELKESVYGKVERLQKADGPVGDWDDAVAELEGRR